jgi:ABC-type transporter Mla maintaining outer membrane lipid asymmetry ATPase subunit MlaF
MGADESMLLDTKVPVRTSSRLPETTLANPNLEEFLNIKTSFAGQNVQKTIRKIIAFARVVLERPRLLLTFEEALAWGGGVSANLDILRRRSAETTVLAITKFNREVLCYDHVILLDGGMVIDTGDPAELLGKESSHFHTYMKETDQLMFNYLKAQLHEQQVKPRAGNEGGL